MAEPLIVIDQVALDQAWPERGHAEREAIDDVLVGGRWSRVAEEGPLESHAIAAEEALARHLAVERFHLVSSGTAAFEIAVESLGLHPGDEVLLPATAYITIVTALARKQLLPVFVDVEDQHGAMDPGSLEERVTSRSRAIVVVHANGMVADMAAICAVAGRHDLPVIEDAAQAFGTRLSEGYAGTLGDVGIFSFQERKVLACGEAGGLTGTPGALDRAVAIGNPCPLPGWSRSAWGLATNARVSSFSAALLTAQLRRFDDQVRRRRANIALLADLLRDAGLRPIPPPDRIVVWNGFDPLFDYELGAGELPKGALVARLQARGLPAVLSHTDPIYSWDVFVRSGIEYRNAGCPVAEALGPRRIAFRHHLFLGPTRWMEATAEAIQDVLRANRPA